VHWVTYRRAPLTVPSRLPVLAEVTVGGKVYIAAYAGDRYERGRRLVVRNGHARPRQVTTLRGRWR